MVSFILYNLFWIVVFMVRIPKSKNVIRIGVWYKFCGILQKRFSFFLPERVKAPLWSTFVCFLEHVFWFIWNESFTFDFKCSKEYGCLGLQPEMGGTFHLKLNITSETDSEQVLWRKVEKDFGKRVKQVPEIVKWGTDRGEK